MQKTIIGVESNCMTNEIDSVVLQSIFLKHFFTRFVDFDSIISLGIAFFEVLDSF
jgi:hypothetical protein